MNRYMQESRQARVHEEARHGSIFAITSFQSFTSSCALASPAQANAMDNRATTNGPRSSAYKAGPA